MAPEPITPTMHGHTLGLDSTVPQGRVPVPVQHYSHNPISPIHRRSQGSPSSGYRYLSYNYLPAPDGAVLYRDTL